MKKIKLLKLKSAAIAIGLCIVPIVLTGCDAGKQETALSAEITPTTPISLDTSGHVSDTLQENFYSNEDTDDSWDEKTSTNIILDGYSIKISGNGASASGSTATITAAGTYVLSGTLNDGQIIINTNKDSIVKLVLNGVTLNNSKSAPVYSAKASKTIIILADGTDNRITDSSNYVYAAGEDEPDAAIFAKNDLTITGSGSLNVAGNFNNAIGTKDDLRITNGNITVSSINDGLRGRDSVLISGGNFIISSGGDGIQSNNDTDAAKGFINISGGQFSITSALDGIQAETSLLLSGGSFEIFTGGGSAAASVKQEDFMRWNAAAQTTTDNTVSMKALKAGALITIAGGNITVDSEDDAIHSNGDIIISGGSFTVSSGDDGFHADNALRIDDGNIRILTSYEGLEGVSVDINGGEITLKALDDGINAAGGNDAGGFGPMGGDQFASNSNAYIRISGGYLEVDADGDGIDSNGKLYFDGGSVFVSGPTSSANGILDSGSGSNVAGGTIIAAGSSGMMDTPSADSAQSILIVYYSSNQTADVLIRLTDENGKEIASYTPTKTYQSVIISSPQLTTGGKYILYTGDEKSSEITLTGTVTSVSDNGSPVTGKSGNLNGQKNPQQIPQDGTRPNSQQRPKR